MKHSISKTLMCITILGYAATNTASTVLHFNQEVYNSIFNEAKARLEKRWWPVKLQNQNPQVYQKAMQTIDKDAQTIADHLMAENSAHPFKNLIAAKAAANKYADVGAVEFYAELMQQYCESKINYGAISAQNRDKAARMIEPAIAAITQASKNNATTIIYRNDGRLNNLLASLKQDANAHIQDKLGWLCELCAAIR